MTVRLLVSARDSRGLGPGQYLKGMIVVVKPGTHVWGGLEGLPDFVQLDISDADDPASIEDRASEWQQILDWDVVNSDLLVDGHRLLIWTTNRRGDGLGDITEAQARNFLEQWGASNIVVGSRPSGAAGVRFDITVFAAATSRGFFERDLTGFVFSELTYTQVTGIHEVRLTYPAGLNHDAVVAEVAAKAVVLTSNPGPRRVDYLVTRMGMLDVFKARMKQELEASVKRRRWYFDTAAVDQAIAVGGHVTRTLSQAQADLVDGYLD